jgi:hypothetical protein
MVKVPKNECEHLKTSTTTLAAISLTGNKKCGLEESGRVEDKDGQCSDVAENLNQHMYIGHLLACSNTFSPVRTPSSLFEHLLAFRTLTV